MIKKGLQSTDHRLRTPDLNVHSFSVAEVEVKTPTTLEEFVDVTFSMEDRSNYFYHLRNTTKRTMSQ
jgi:hypothetical protein